MTKRNTFRIALVGAVAVVAAAAAGILLANRAEREWTTDSPAALAELRAGLDEEQKLYLEDAIAHYERALELDPDFVAAKFLLLTRMGRMAPEDRRAALRAEILAADREALTPRERFLIEHLEALAAEEPERAHQILVAYVERHPDDPFVLAIRCRVLWDGGDHLRAEECFRRLIEIEPNWVDAQNLLGYLAMAQGDWRRAEEQFAIYRYLAPDQANPHDSLGEMLLLTGRWEEARREFEQAIAIKPDFCPSWNNLYLIAMLQGDYDGAAALTDRLAEDGVCTDVARFQRCRSGVWPAFAEGDWPRAFAAFGAPECEGYYGDAQIMAYEAALLAGLDDEAAALAAKVEAAPHGRLGDDDRSALALHLDGIRLRLAGRPGEAAERFRDVDGVLAYWRPDMGYFKLANLLQLWQALGEEGREAEAAEVLEGLRAVNPAIAERWTRHAQAAGGDGRGSAPRTVERVPPH